MAEAVTAASPNPDLDLSYLSPAVLLACCTGSGRMTEESTETCC